MSRRALVTALVVGLQGVLLAACGPLDVDEVPYAVEVVSFAPGAGAGFGQDAMPDVVFGPPHGGTTSQGSLDVVSLGRGGVITLRMGEPIVDRPGPDLLVFENPFEVGAGAGIFGESAQVSVSDDGETFFAFACDPDAALPNGCAGWGVVVAGVDNGIDATDARVAGGDAFDLREIGVSRARYVRLEDRGTASAPPSAGFDLDAVAVVLRP